MTEIEKISEELAEYGVPDELIGKIEDLLATLYGEKRKLEIEKSWIFLQSQWGGNHGH
ncbi:Uncharacterised protein [Streptococcus pneumoniae]|nr:hypothetical protein [Streptococcus pneumoniae]MBZ4246689.1 hypothetical protein [Streptococcus pneumoniae]MDD0792633.1 hypothetical protein [Streptococcus pneumoniae]MDS2301324.1 hypothetical protein [Streptococcus pneumoniae]MDS2334619.1 hypothetical protein [Streptococcus pneumoniae]MDS2359105.1 hypothetical protein [Streptococcus pneumoniae]